MFERLTDRARKVLVLTQHEAGLLNHDFIGTEHLLLGLIHEEEGVAARALVSLGITLEKARAEVSDTRGPLKSPAIGAPPFTPRARKVLELAQREALSLGVPYIGTEHLLLGLVREGEGVGAHVILTLGADLQTLVQRVMTLLEGEAQLRSTTVATAPLAGTAEGPLCPTCRSPLEGQVTYRILSVPAAGRSDATDGVDVMFVYCLACGVLLAHAPAGNVGVKSGAGAEAENSAHLTSGAAVDAERVIADGKAMGEVRWVLRAGGTDTSYSTIFRIEDAQGVISSGGMGGPKLWGSDRLNVYTGGNPDRGPRAIVVRCDPAIAHLTLVYEDGTETGLIDCGEFDGLRFGVLLVSPDARLGAIVGSNLDKGVVGSFDLRGTTLRGAETDRTDRRRSKRTSPHGGPFGPG